MRFAAERLRHKALGFSWNMPAFGEEVGMLRSQDKKLIKSANNRGAIGRLIEVTPWQNGTTSLIAKGSDLQNPEIIQGLQPKTVAVECLRLSEPRTIPEGWTKSALDGLKERICGSSSRLVKHSTLCRLCRSLLMPRLLIPLAYWGDVNEAGNDQVRQEVLDFVCPTHQPEQLRTSLTKTVPKARVIPNKVVMQTKGVQYERWKQATSKELQAFLQDSVKRTHG